MHCTGLAYIVEPMQLEDIPEVMEIERVSFPTPWPASAYRHEVRQNRLAHYFVARRRFADEAEADVQDHQPGLLEKVQRWARRPGTAEAAVVGYCGFWMAADEAHISTIAVHPNCRQRGVGQLLLIAAIERAVQLGANLISLEVRVSNVAAQNLYRKYGFQVVGRRRRYYSDNREDALIMTAEFVASAPYQRLLKKCQQQLAHRLAPIPLDTSSK